MSYVFLLRTAYVSCIVFHNPFGLAGPAVKLTGVRSHLHLATSPGTFSFSVSCLPLGPSPSHFFFPWLEMHLSQTYIRIEARQANIVLFGIMAWFLGNECVKLTSNGHGMNPLSLLNFTLLICSHAFSVI